MSKDAIRSYAAAGIFCLFPLLFANNYVFAATRLIHQPLLSSTTPGQLSAQEWHGIKDRIGGKAPTAATNSANSVDILQQAYLKPSNNNISDYYYFSYAVAVSGDTLVVGAYREASNATGVGGDQTNFSMVSAGAAYVFVRVNGTWSQQAYLKASNTQSSDRFGYAVAISGDTIVVGAYVEDSDATTVDGDQSNDLNQGAGAAYVFVRSGVAWSQQAYLKAANNKAFDNFGFSVAIDGDTAVIGALNEDSNATGVDGDSSNIDASNAGAAYVFLRTGTSWAQQAYLKASNTDESDNFGTSVAISGNAIVVGANSEDGEDTGVNGDETGNLGYSSGAAYVFVRTGNSWAQQAYLKASNAEVGDNFGASVAISADSLVVGARFESSASFGVNGDETDNSAGASGAAYVFNRDGAMWTQQAYLKASNTGTDDFFGNSVAIASDTVAVGAYLEDGVAPNSGAAYLFTRNGVSWSELAYVKAPNAGPSDYLGRAVAVADGNLLVGAYQEASNANGVDGDGLNDLGPGSGAAYVFNSFIFDLTFADGFE